MELHRETHDHPVETTTAESGEAKQPDVLIKLTEKAVEMVKEAIKSEPGLKGTAALRVYVEGGGCSGYKYGLDFDENEAGDDDLIFAQDGVQIFIDQYSGAYLRGTVIDYVSGLNGAGFKFLNPNAQRTCGCGSSFSA
jgi:iron-sulfur cluster assembly accessory protein